VVRATPRSVRAGHRQGARTIPFLRSGSDSCPLFGSEDQVELSYPEV
jgi:hypothetical protein